MSQTSQPQAEAQVQAPRPSQPEAAAPAPAPAPAPEPLVVGETSFDRVSSALMALVVGLGILVGFLALLYLTNRGYASKVAAPVEIIEVYGGGGGQPDGVEGSTEQIDVSDAEAAEFASNNELDPNEFEEPSVQETPSAMLDAMMEATEEFADLPEEMPTGSATATGKRASKLGTGAAAYGFGPGDGGVPREQRWSIVYNPGQTVDEYARLLDYYGIEMATIIDGQMHYARNFSSGSPEVRVTTRGNDDRLYFLWQGSGRRSSDIEVLRRAGIEVGRSSPIFQFFPPEVEQNLVRLEQAFQGRQPAEIRTTTFTVEQLGRRFAFKVIDQQPLN